MYVKIKVSHLIIGLVLLGSLVWGGVVLAGDPDTPPGDPASTTSFSMEDLYQRLVAGTAGAQRAFTEPDAGPGAGTMHTINEIMGAAPALDNTNGATTTQVMSGKTYWGLRSGAWGPLTGTGVIASGNATDAQVLTGTTYSNNSGASIGTMVNNGAGGIITPTTTNQSVAAGYWSTVNTVQGDADLTAANIVSGTAIFGVDGIAVEASGNATDAQVLSGRTYSNDSGAGTGTMANNGAGSTIVPTTTNQSVAAGYWSTVNTVQGDADLTAGNIVSGTAIFGVDGSAVEASGNATDAQVLSGRTYSNDSGAGTGTMTNNGAGSTIVPTTTNQSVAAGYWSTVNTVQGDADLTAGNIKGGVTLFGVDGALYAPVPKTGITVTLAAGDDGNLERGVAWPVPRFITGTTGVVTDTLTGLIWLKDANCTDTVGGIIKSSGILTWTNALTWSNNLATGKCGLTDGSSTGDWRLPNVRELQSLIDYGEYNPALPNGHPFTGVQSDAYWSSTTNNPPQWAWYVDLYSGHVYRAHKAATYHVWSVRGGQ